jgi:hypothetical protein
MGGLYGDEWTGGEDTADQRRFPETIDGARGVYGHPGHGQYDVGDPDGGIVYDGGTPLVATEASGHSTFDPANPLAESGLGHIGEGHADRDADGEITDADDTHSGPEVFSPGTSIFDGGDDGD